jgi:uncharacterized protein
MSLSDRSVQRVRKPFWSRFLRRLAVLSGLAAVLSVYVCAIEPNWYDIHAVRLELPHLAPEFDGYRIVQISDIHADRWMTQNRLAQIVDRVNQQHPDLVALTGDFVTRSPEIFAPTLSAFEALQPKDRTVAVLGNHDVVTDSQPIQEALELAGVKVLINQSITLQRQNSQLHVAGVGDFWFKLANLTPILTELPNRGAAILLAHEPDFADISSSTGRFDLQLSGHSHGGQVHIPFIKRLVPRLANKYPVGQYQVGSTIQYTNRGVGMAPLHLRFNCRPEITVFTLKSLLPA